MAEAEQLPIIPNYLQNPEFFYARAGECQTMRKAIIAHLHSVEKTEDKVAAEFAPPLQPRSMRAATKQTSRVLGFDRLFFVSCVTKSA